MTGVHPYFEPAEFAARAEQVRASLVQRGIDVALFDEIEAMTWVSGYGNSENRWRCVGMPVSAEPFFVIRALDAGPCRQRTWISDVSTFRDWDDPMPVLARCLAARGLQAGRIGVDLGSYCLPPARLERLRATLPDAEVIDIGALVSELRLRKSPAEIALLRRAATVADAALLATAAACVPGATQRKAAKVAVSSFIELGADPGPPGPISAGRGWDFLHGHLEDVPLRAGDVVHIELTPRISGYSARLMRCAVIGSPTPTLQHAAERLADIQDRQIAAMWPGANAAEVDAILRDTLIAEGMRESYDNITGYTLGFYAAAGPRTSDFTRIFHPGADWSLESGMVFHMYASAAGVSFSETVHVTANGPERLTKLPRTLLSTAVTT